MLRISRQVTIPDNEIEINAIRSSGAGGQNVNKVSTAIHLRFNSQDSSLPEYYKKRLLKLKDRRINKDGIIVIKSQQTRSQERNREIALARLQQLIQSVSLTRKKRIPTRPSAASQLNRLERKRKHGRLKQSRKKNIVDE